MANAANGTLGELVRRRLKEIKRSSEDLAEAVELPTEYIDELIDGSRRPPLPGRTDIYPKMTSFLRLGRNDVITRALAERGAQTPGTATPAAPVRELLMAMCQPVTAKKLEQRRARKGSAELAGLLQRLLDVAQGSVRRLLDDPITLRLGAAERGSTYQAMRLEVLDFLDTSAGSLTAAHLTQFLRPRVESWDVDLETNVLRVKLRTHSPRDRRPRPAQVEE